MSDKALDKTVAYVVSCLLVAVLAGIGLAYMNHYQGWQFEREAVKAGYCHVANAPGSTYFHWEKCQPPTSAK